jgi:hypothetical protein
MIAGTKLGNYEEDGVSRLNLPRVNERDQTNKL